MYKPKYFSLSELLHSDTAERQNINNVPTFQVVYNLNELCRLVLDPARIALGEPIKVNSGYRSITLNNAVGGVANSQHLQGLAADITAADLQKLFAVLVKNPNIDQLLFERNKRGGRWIHVSISANGRPRHIINNNYLAK